MKKTRTKKCKHCKQILGQNGWTHFPPHGLFCDWTCYNNYLKELTFHSNK